MVLYSWIQNQSINQIKTIRVAGSEIQGLLQASFRKLQYMFWSFFPLATLSFSTTELNASVFLKPCIFFLTHPPHLCQIQPMIKVICFEKCLALPCWLFLFELEPLWRLASCWFLFSSKSHQQGIKALTFPCSSSPENRILEQFTYITFKFCLVFISFSRLSVCGRLKDKIMYTN